MKGFLSIFWFVAYLSLNSVAHAEIVDSNGVLRSDDGKPLKLQMLDAIKSCARQGMRLATIRELVSLSKGVTFSEYNETTNNRGRLRPKQAMNILNLLNQEDLDYIFDERKVLYKDYVSAYLRSSIPFETYRRSVESFYIDTRDYVRPEGDLGRLEFWSASLDYGYPDRAFTFRFDDGDLRYFGIMMKVNLAVRCIEGKQPQP